MSAVDVLAVLDAVIEQTRLRGGYPGLGSLTETRDAVANLIKLGTAVEEADSSGVVLTDELMDKFRAALARVGGA